MPLLSTPFPSLPLRPKPLSLKRVSPRTCLANSDPPGPSSQSPDQLDLLEKPAASSVTTPESETRQPVPDLAPFFQLFSNNDLSNDETPYVEQNSQDILKDNGASGIGSAYYQPQAGEFAMGVVVASDNNKIEVDIGADKMGIMLRKEVMPLSSEEMEDLGCDFDEIKGYRCKIGIIKDDMSKDNEARKSVVEVGTMVYAEVLGRTLGGRPVLSSRRLFRRLAWHRVRQIMHNKEPIEVKIYEWNTGGLLTRIEGLRAFLPRAELIIGIKNFMDFKNSVGRITNVCIIKIDEETNDLVISEKEAWDKMYLQTGTLLRGKVVKIHPYGAQIRLGETYRNGLLHVSCMSKHRIDSINEVVKLNEELKVLVVNSMFPDKIALSTSELESEPGLFLKNKARVFEEAEEMARNYRRKLPVINSKRDEGPISEIQFDEIKMYSNSSWFKFEQPVEANSNNNDNVTNVDL